MKIDFDWSEFQKKFLNLSDDIFSNVKREIDIELEKGARRIEKDAAKGAPVNLGDLRNSIESRKVSGFGSKIIWEVRVNAPQGLWIEFGTKPHWAPIEPLLDWVLDKKLAKDEGEAWLIADAVQAKIAKYGTSPQPFFRPAFYKNEKIINKSLKRALGRALKK